MVVVKPHDLLQIASLKELFGNDLPVWATAVFPQSLTVVVRRSPILNNQIPVSIRGQKREQRFATYINRTAIQKIITPYDLVKNKVWNDLSEDRKELPAIMALPEVAKILQTYHWGVSGSVGFELATKVKTAKLSSDLDLVWQPDTSLSKNEAKFLLKKLNQFGVHVDLQVIRGNNGFSLEEYANSKSTIMVKTLRDPILVNDPWL